MDYDQRAVVDKKCTGWTHVVAQLILHFQKEYGSPLKTLKNYYLRQHSTDFHIVHTFLVVSHPENACNTGWTRTTSLPRFDTSICNSWDRNLSLRNTSGTFRPSRFVNAVFASHPAHFASFLMQQINFDIDQIGTWTNIDITMCQYGGNLDNYYGGDIIQQLLYSLIYVL